MIASWIAAVGCLTVSDIGPSRPMRFQVTDTDINAIIRTLGLGLVSWSLGIEHKIIEMIDRHSSFVLLLL